MSKSINRVKSIMELTLKQHIENGRKEITTKEELDEFSIGSLISYINKNGIYKAGGFLLKIKNDYFIYMNPHDDKKFRVQFVNVNKMWVGSPYDSKNDIVSIRQTEQPETNFPVKIGNITVFYAQSTYDQKRFNCTKKGKLMYKWYELFGLKQ